MLILALALTLAPAVTVETREVRVRDLVVADGTLDLATADLVVLRLAADRARTALSAATVAALLRRRAPGLTVRADEGAEVTIARRAASPPRPTAPCFATRRALAAGNPIASGDVVAAPCSDGTPRAVRYDRRTGSTLAAHALPEGAALGALALAPYRVIAPGTPLTLRSIAGPVTIERAVTTLQPGRSGGRVFVRDADGAVLSVALELETTP